MEMKGIKPKVKIRIELMATMAVETIFFRGDRNKVKGAMRPKLGLTRVPKPKAKPARRGLDDRSRLNQSKAKRTTRLSVWPQRVELAKTAGLER